MASALKIHELEEAHRQAQKERGFDVTIGTQAAYAVRWDRVLNALRKLEAAIIEAEATWEPEIKQVCEPLWKLQAELFHAISQHQRIMGGKSRSPITAEASMKIDSIVFNMADPDKPDQFTARLETAIKELQEKVQPRLVSAFPREAYTNCV